MKGTCSICNHESRAVIDRMLAEAGDSTRTVATQFGLSQSATARHWRNHLNPGLIAALGKQALEAQRLKGRQEMEQQRETGALASAWLVRLEEAWEVSSRGMAKAELDPLQWGQGARFLAGGLKAIELGLRADGVIEGAGHNAGNTTINVEQVLVLPQKQQLTHSVIPCIEATYESDDPIS